MAEKTDEYFTDLVDGGCSAYSVCTMSSHLVDDDELDRTTSSTLMRAYRINMPVHHFD